MKGRTVPEHGKGTLGTNEWDWQPHVRADDSVSEKSGTFVYKRVTGAWTQKENREQRRRAIARKRKGQT